MATMGGTITLAVGFYNSLYYHIISLLQLVDGIILC